MIITYSSLLHPDYGKWESFNLLVESGVREFWLAESGTLGFKTPNTA